MVAGRRTRFSVGNDLKTTNTLGRGKEKEVCLKQSPKLLFLAILFGILCIVFFFGNSKLGQFNPSNRRLTLLVSNTNSIFVHNEKHSNVLSTRKLADDHTSTDDHPTDDHQTDDHSGDDHDDHTGDDHDDHSTDDHGDDAAHASTSLFGSIEHLTIGIGTMSILITVGFVCLLELSFHVMHAFTHDTSYYPMVLRIENELMIVGCSAFLFKVLINTTEFLDADWEHSLEFAELLIPILSFCYCVVGIFLIMVVLKQCDTWSKAYHIKLLELLDEYYSKCNTWLFKLSWKPLMKIINEMEFRIFHSLFCDMFKIQRTAFAFDEYVQKVYEKFVMEIIEIRLIDWFIVSVLVVLNLVRTKLHVDYGDCDRHDTKCVQRSALIMFMQCGAIIYGITLIFVWVSRSLERKIMAAKGLHSWHDYAPFLEDMNEDDFSEEGEEHRLDVGELKMAALNARSQSSKINKSPQQFIHQKTTSAKLFMHRLNLKVTNFHLPRVSGLTKGRTDSVESPEAVEALIQLSQLGTALNNPRGHHQPENHQNSTYIRKSAMILPITTNSNDEMDALPNNNNNSKTLMSQSAKAHVQLKPVVTHKRAVTVTGATSSAAKSKLVNGSDRSDLYAVENILECKSGSHDDEDEEEERSGMGAVFDESMIIGTVSLQTTTTTSALHANKTTGGQQLQQQLSPDKNGSHGRDNLVLSSINDVEDFSTVISSAAAGAGALEGARNNETSTTLSNIANDIAVTSTATTTTQPFAGYTPSATATATTAAGGGAGRGSKKRDTSSLPQQRSVSPDQLPIQGDNDIQYFDEAEEKEYQDRFQGDYQRVSPIEEMSHIVATASEQRGQGQHRFSPTNELQEYHRQPQQQQSSQQAHYSHHQSHTHTHNTTTVAVTVSRGSGHSNKKTRPLGGSMDLNSKYYANAALLDRIRTSSNVDDEDFQDFGNARSSGRIRTSSHVSHGSAGSREGGELPSTGQKHEENGASGGAGGGGGGGGAGGGTRSRSNTGKEGSPGAMLSSLLKPLSPHAIIKPASPYNNTTESLTQSFNYDGDAHHQHLQQQQQQRYYGAEEALRPLRDQQQDHEAHHQQQQHVPFHHTNEPLGHDVEQGITTGGAYAGAAGVGAGASAGGATAGAGTAALSPITSGKSNDINANNDRRFSLYLQRAAMSFRRSFKFNLSPKNAPAEQHSPAFYEQMAQKEGIPKRRMTILEEKERAASFIDRDGKEVMNIFWFSNPDIFFESVQLIIILIAFYLALWLTNFIVTSENSGWKLLSLLPGFLSAVNYMYIVKTAAMVKAIYRIDIDAVLEVLEQTEGVIALSEELREKVLIRLHRGTNTLVEAEQELQRLFKEIDDDGSNSLSREEFAHFMNRLGINFSRKKWRQIYREIDRNFDNRISFQEFYLFLYPERDVALALEMKRLKVIKKRVFQNAVFKKGKLFSTSVRDLVKVRRPTVRKT